MAAYFPILTGCERSGTTLLRAMVDAHGDVAVPDESHFLPSLAARRHRIEVDAQVEVTALLEALSASPGFRRWGMDRDLLLQRLSMEPLEDLAAAVHVIYATYAGQYGKSRYADKTTTYVFAMPTIAALLPDARFVHLIRDGRDVALSLLQVAWGPTTIEEAAAWWRVRVETARSAGATLGPGRYLEVRFDALVSDTETELARATSFLGIPWDDRMLRYHERAPGTILDRMPARRQTTHANLGRPPTASLRSWRRELPAASQLAFEALAGDLLDDLGYERRFPSVTPISCPDERRALLDRQRRRRAA